MPLLETTRDGLPNTELTTGDIMSARTACLSLFLAVLSIQGAWANQNGQAQVSAQSPVQTIELRDERYEPVYGEVPYASTCSRIVFDHYENQCTTVNDSVCSGGGEVCTTQNDSVCNSGGCVNVPRRVCHIEPRSCTVVPRRECRQVSVNRTDYYSCTRYRTEVVGQRLAKTYVHEIEVRIESPSALPDANLFIGVNASEERIRASLQSSFSDAILNYRIETLSRNDSGDAMNLSSRILISRGISRMDASQILSTQVSGLELGHDALRFKIENGSSLLDSLLIRVNLVRNPKLWASTTLYNDELSARTLGLVGQGADVDAVIPLSRLGVDSLGSNRYDLGVSVRLDAGKVLNADDFQEVLGKSASEIRNKIYASF